MGRLRTPRRSQPQQLVGLDPSNKYAKRVIDGFFGTSGLTLRGKVITDSANITKTVSAAGKVRRGAANAGFSFPCDLTVNNGITIVFQYVQHSRSGTQVLFEHSVNQNTNAGTFLLYTDSTTSRLNFGTSVSVGYDAGYVTAPALGSVVTVALRLRFTASGTTSDDIGIWVNGVDPAFTATNNNNGTINFGNYSTYFLSRAASSLQADASASMYAVLSGFASDAELRELSLNPWQLFAPVQRSIWVPVAAGGDSTITQADGTSTASSLGGSATAATTPAGAAGTSTASTVAASATAAAGITDAVGVSTASTITGFSTAAGAITQADAATTASTLTGAGLTAGASSITPAAGASTASGLAGSSVAASDVSAADGVSAGETLAGVAGTNIAAGSITPASGGTTASDFAASATAATVAIAAAGASAAATLTSNGVMAVAGAMAGRRMAVTGRRPDRLQTATRPAR